MHPFSSGYPELVLVAVGWSPSSQQHFPFPYGGCRGVPRPDEIYNPSSNFWFYLGPLLEAWKTSKTRHPGGILTRLLNHLSWLLLTWRSRSSTQGASLSASQGGCKLTDLHETQTMILQVFDDDGAQDKLMGSATKGAWTSVTNFLVMHPIAADTFH